MTDEKMGWNATFCMAVGGMIGGGIFSVLGVVVGIAGPWAWASFVVGGVIALLTATSYVGLADAFGEGGGAFTFLREVGRPGIAGSVAWVLIGGYVLTTAVYAFTFGHYLAEVLGGGALVARALAVAVMASLVALNLRGVGESARFEIAAVWAKLVVLGLLAAVGIARWSPEQLADDVPGGSISGVLVGAAAIFMAYEGFQLLAYDYDDIDRPSHTLRRALLPAVVLVTAVYVLVALGSATLVGAGTLVEEKEVALAAAGEAAAGTFGKVLVSVAAALSAGSAINATLFATARLVRRVASEGELPHSLAGTNRRGLPGRAIVVLGAAGTVLAAVGSLGRLVEAASLTFLVTFAVVNALAALRLPSQRLLAVVGAIGAGGAAAVATWRLATTEPIALALLTAMIVAAVGVRPLVLERVGD